VAAADAVAGVVIAVAAEVDVRLAEVAGAEGGRTAAPVEWEEAVDVRLATGLQRRAAAIAEAEVVEGPGTGRRRGLVTATAPAGLLRTGTWPAETSTDLKPPPGFNLVRKAPGPLFRRLPKVGGAGLAAKGFRTEVEERALVSLQVKVREPGVANSQQAEAKAAKFPIECKAANLVQWPGARSPVDWREVRSVILVEAIWAVEAIWVA
jgi:hypothetical protein